MGSVIAAINFSKTSNNALHYAAAVAKLFGVKLIVFNAFKVPVHMLNTRFSAASLEGLLEVTRAKLMVLSEEISKNYNIEVEYQCSYVDFEREIDALMLTHNSELLVMGMSEKSMEQNLLGNPTTAIISVRKFPVLAVPIQAKFSGIDKVLFACDLMEKIPLKTLVRLRKLTKALKSEVVLFYVDEKIDEILIEEKSQNQFDKDLEGVVHYYKKVKSDSVIKAIEKEIHNSSPDILVMVPKKYGFWESIIHKSKTRSMASGLNIPLLSIPVD